MALLLALALCDDVPWRLSVQEAGARPGREEVFGAEAYVLRTSFDEGLKIEDGFGAGADFNFRWRWNEKTRLGFHVGFAAWDSELDISGVSEDDVNVAMYRVGVGAEFPFGKVVELGLASTLGIYRFHRDGESDASPFVEFEGSLGFRPSPMFKFGGLVMATHTQSSFNRSHTHLFHNYSAGVFVEFSF
ncbi:MAG TPA: hypothetical protein VF950_14595 [Planctomycetota bacterium]